MEKDILIMEKTINIYKTLLTSLIIKEMKIKMAHTYNFVVYQTGTFWKVIKAMLKRNEMGASENMNAKTKKTV